MCCIQRIGQGPTTAQSASVDWRSGAWGSSHCRVYDFTTSVPGVFSCGQVDILATVVLAVKTEHLDLLDVPRRV